MRWHKARGAVWAMALMLGLGARIMPGTGMICYGASPLAGSGGQDSFQGEENQQKEGSVQEGTNQQVENRVQGDAVKQNEVMLEEVGPQDADAEEVLWDSEEDWDSEEELSDEEMNRLLEVYLSQLNGASASRDISASDIIESPVLKMEQEDGGGFRYTLPNGNFFLSSVPNGMITTEPVNLSLTGGTVGIVERDGVADVLSDSWHFTQKGSYYIRLLMFQPPGSTAQDYNVYEVKFYFAIISGTDNTLGAVPAPLGFVIDQVRLDGELQEALEERCCFLGEDGYYEIRYKARDDERIRAETRFERDTNAPFLSFSPELQGGVASGTVEFSPSEPGCRVYMNYNGGRGYAVSTVLAAAGNYELSVEDGAGNRREYHLRIRQTYNPVDRRVILAAVLLLAAAAVRLVLFRRDMKVL